ncbi:CAP domain-containing protein [Halobacillus litoralis]|uniref:CAP domain-containing protein n=1 Tax=Halobacillus litoralis TaxID=45668 RepID=UPI001CFF4AD5|nr:CAP domain-containing protein [Halobacillus litoralis]WLR47064.1 CAP domain-containing protein [Halobacillus litoralis]
MIKKSVILCLVTFIFVGLYFLFNSPLEEQVVQEFSEPTIETVGQPQAQNEADFFSFRGLSSDALLEEIGEPLRKDPSEYGYDWWVYGSEEEIEMQFGIQDREVVTGVLFKKESGPVRVQDSYEEVAESYPFESSYRLDSEGAYTLKLTEKDIAERPVISLGERWTAQLYFDNVTNEIFAIRMLRNDVLLKHQPYKVIYRGTLPLQEVLDKKAWERIEDGMEAQILSITNGVRALHEAGLLLAHEEASFVAYAHSRDMNQNNYFSHYSQNGEGLKERLGEIPYVRAGENIASQYVDATAAVHGWLNSPGHRKALLDPLYTHLGVGVHQRYYTQNFLTVP